MTNTYSVYGTIASSSTAVPVSLAPRWSYITFKNLGVPLSTGPETQIVWVRTDGTAAVKQADFCFAVMPGESVLLANMAPLWTQSATVIAASTDIANPLAAGSPGWPGTPGSPIIFGASLYGGTANPGTTVSVILDTGSTSTPFVVEAAG